MRHLPRIFALFLVLATAWPSMAQINDTILVQTPGKGRTPGVINLHDLIGEGFNFWEEKFSGHWTGIHLGINGFLREDYSLYPEQEHGFMENHLRKSNVLNINFFQHSFGLQHSRNTIGLVTGLGLGIQAFRLDNNTTIRSASDGLIHPEILYFESNQKSKLSSVYLNIPLLLEFQVPVNHYANRFYLAAGVVGSKRLSTHTKIKYRVDRQKQKLKTPDDYYMPDYKYAVLVKTGYRWLHVFATYDLVPLFKEGRGPELYPFSAGVTLLSF